MNYEKKVYVKIITFSRMETQTHKINFGTYKT